MMRELMIATALVFVGIPTGSLMAIEEASFDVVVSDGKYQVRDYAQQVIAEIQVEEGFEDAGDEAFSKLFKYIRGDNQSSDKIAMTAPVAQEKRSEKIAMTSPVAQQASEDGWAVSFLLPSEYSLESAPTPTDPAVQLRAIPERRMATIRYSGRWTEKNYQKKLDELTRWIDEQGLVINGDPVWARYNPPFTPPFWRRNEIMIPVRS